MSAILARINFDGSPIVRDAFCHAFEILAPYGSDGSTTWIEGSVGLGQHLLRFTPESCYEQQPHCWENAIIVADARIDNRDALCNRFGLSEGEAAVTPDSHLILRAYRLWGEDCTPHLLGDFAFAIWDRENRRLFCARDHVGARPLYYYHTPSITVVATDIRALQALPGVKCEIDEQAIATYLIWPNGITKRTFFKSLHVLQPGQQMSVNATGLALDIHWTPDDASDIRYKSPEEYAEHFRSVLETAVAARIRTDYLIGSHLSGGLDSSGLTVLANQQLRQQGRSLKMAYTWSPAKSDAYPPVRGDERNTIEALCRQEEIPIHYSTTTGQDFRDFLSRDMAVEMTADVLEEFSVITDAGQRGIRTILSGWGGDEAATSGGRGYIASLLKHGRLLRLARITKHHAGVRRPRRTLRYFFRYALLPLLPDILYDRFDPYHRSDRQTLYLDPAFAAQFPDLENPYAAFWREIADPRKMQVLLLQSGQLANRMATWAVWASPHQLIHSYPLTDRRVLEFAVGLPPDLLYQKGKWRYLFREALKDVLPPLPPKADPANERKRLKCEQSSWQILSGEVRAGLWSSNDTPWIDLDKLRAKLLAAPDNNMTQEQQLEFFALIPPVRVWHLWQHYRARVGD